MGGRLHDEAARVLRELQVLCNRAAPGERLPTHRDLMRRYRASERMVLRALDDLQRLGVIVRRGGIGTFVTERGGTARSTTVLPACAPTSILAIARPDRSFFDRCLEVLHRLTQADGRQVVIYPLEDDNAGLTLPPPAARPAGIMLFHQRFTALAGRLLADGCRVVLVGTPAHGTITPVPCVYSDHEQGGYLATLHLLHRGHRRLAMLGGDGGLEHTPRWRGHQRAVMEAQTQDPTVTASVITQKDLAAWEADPRLVVDWWQGPHGATGVACWNDREAARLLAVLTRAHINVPDDIGLVGYDDLPDCRVVHPPLTTIDQQIEQQVRAALALLTVSKPMAASRTVVSPALIPRASSESRVR
jgi:DNA-binding LacI/PurR family transcriptional regulator